MDGLGSSGILLSLADVGKADQHIPLDLEAGKYSGVAHGSPLDCEEAIKFASDHDIHCMVETYPFSKVKEAVDSTPYTRGKAKIQKCSGHGPVMLITWIHVAWQRIPHILMRLQLRVRRCLDVCQWS